MPREILVPIDVEFRSSNALKKFREKLAKELDRRNQLEDSLQNGFKTDYKGRNVHISQASKKDRIRQIRESDFNLTTGTARVFDSINRSRTGEDVSLSTGSIGKTYAAVAEDRWVRTRRIKRKITPLQLK